MAALLWSVGALYYLPLVGARHRRRRRRSGICAWFGSPRGPAQRFPHDVPRLFPAQETSQLLEKYGGKFDYRDVDLDQVEGAGLDSIATLAQLTTASL